MIPVFPQFKHLELSDKEQLEGITQQHHPYSDYNFTSLWSWDIDNTIQVSQLNNNLVLRFSDYATREQFFSFLGTNDVDDTIEALLLMAKEEGLTAALKLIPEVSTEHIQQSHLWVVEEDVDNHDYVLSVEKLQTFSGNKLGPKRNFVNRFERAYGENATSVELDLHDKNVQKSVMEVFEDWVTRSSYESSDAENERSAIQRLLTHIDFFDVHGVGVFVNQKLIAFSIDEVLPNGHGLIHYEKADNSFVGVFAYLKKQSAQIFFEKGCHLINYEQDLGVEGLRKLKRSYRPVDMFKKYTVYSASKK